MDAAFWTTAIITVVSALVSVGFAVAGSATAVPAAREASMYALARSIALVVVAVIPLFTASISIAVAVAIAMIIVQALDTVIGVRIHDRQKTFGPLALAVLNAVALAWLVFF